VAEATIRSLNLELRVIGPDGSFQYDALSAAPSDRLPSPYVRWRRVGAVGTGGDPVDDDASRWISPFFTKARRRAPNAGWAQLTRITFDLAFEADPVGYERHHTELVDIAMRRSSTPAAKVQLEDTEFFSRLESVSISPMVRRRT
jgi:hypothetical protein